MALCIAIFDKDNVLLYLKVKETELPRENDLHMFLYCSYDIVGEKARLALNKSAQEPYLGSLLLNNSFRSYGYLTNTNVKLLLLVSASDNILKDHDIRAIFKKLHTNYSNAVTNPFHTPGTSLHDSKFLNHTVEEIFGG